MRGQAFPLAGKSIGNVSIEWKWGCRFERLETGDLRLETLTLEKCVGGPCSVEVLEITYSKHVLQSPTLNTYSSHLL
jgi:hypothetical protein